MPDSAVLRTRTSPDWPPVGWRTTSRWTTSWPIDWKSWPKRITSLWSCKTAPRRIAVNTLVGWAAAAVPPWSLVRLIWKCINCLRMRRKRGKSPIIRFSSPNWGIPNSFSIPRLPLWFTSREIPIRTLNCKHGNCTFTHGYMLIIVSEWQLQRWSGIEGG